MGERRRYRLILPLLFLVGCGREASDAVRIVHAKSPPLRVGVFPLQERSNLLETLQPLLDHLAARLDRAVDLRVVERNRDLEALVAQGRIDLGFLGPRPRRGSPAEALCWPVLRHGPFYHGLIVTRKDRPFRSLADLQGRSFAYVARYSWSGFDYPNRMLLAQGIHPLRHFGSVSFAGTHDHAFQGVLKGTWDAAALSNLFFRPPERRVLRERLRVLARTDPIRLDPVMIRANLDPALKKRLRQIFLEMTKRPSGKGALRALSALGLDRFTATP